MAKCELVLLKEDEVQKKWANYSRVHGVYVATINADSLYFSSMSPFPLLEFTDKSKPCYLRGSASILLKAFALGNVTTNGEYINMVGRFTKTGNQVHFEVIHDVRFD